MDLYPEHLRTEIDRLNDKVGILCSILFNPILPYPILFFVLFYSDSTLSSYQLHFLAVLNFAAFSHSRIFNQPHTRLYV